jgi:two-component system, NarL family, sensor kinase
VETVALIAAGLAVGLAAGLAVGLAGSQRRLRSSREEIARLAHERATLVSQVVQAEESTRSRVAQALHDDALQSLLAAHQDLIEAAPGRAGVTRAHEVVGSAIDRVREAVASLHPVTLEQGGLETALTVVCDQAERHGSFRSTLKVDPEATSPHDQLIVSLARELVTNAVRHSGASEVQVAVTREGDQVVLQVADDGEGIPPGRREQALREGHVGLASVAQRLEAIGGELEVETDPDRGTRIRGRMPATPSA